MKPALASSQEFTSFPYCQCSFSNSVCLTLPNAKCVLKWSNETWNETGENDRKRNGCHTNPLTPATPKRLCNDIGGQRGHRGRPLLAGGGWSPGYSLGVAGWRRGRQGLGQTNSQWSVCLGFLRGDRSSQSLPNGNQLTANKAIARLGLFAFVVDLWRWCGRGGVLFIVLYSPKTLQRRREGRVYIEPDGFDPVFPKQKICWCALQWKWLNPLDVLTLFGSFHSRQVVFTSHSAITQTTSLSWLLYGSNFHKKKQELRLSPDKCTLVSQLKSHTLFLSSAVQLVLSSSSVFCSCEGLCVFPV